MWSKCACSASRIACGSLRASAFSKPFRMSVSISVSRNSTVKLRRPLRRRRRYRRMRSAASEGERGRGATASGVPLGSRFDIFQFPFRFNPGTNGGNVEMGLINKSYLLTLNQRVQGSSPCAPTIISHYAQCLNAAQSKDSGSGRVSFALRTTPYLTKQE